MRPAGMSQAVIVQGFPSSIRGSCCRWIRRKTGRRGSADKQVLGNLEAVLKDSGSGLDELVRLNIYA